jgi:hypothetical protein
MALEITRMIQELLKLIEKNGEMGIFIAFISSVLAFFIAFSFLKFVWRILTHFFLRFSKKYVLN